MNGKVYLVGAGPGHPKLLTLRAAELLREADVVIYDRLIQPGTLALANPQAEMIYVGKAPGSHQRQQEEINQLLVEKAKQASKVVRLKGGDAMLFAHGGEEAEYLSAQGVEFELVPGVTAGMAAPMAAGIPLSHRDWAASVVMVTGHQRADGEPHQIDWAAIAKIDTIVLFMAVSNLPQIVQQLLKHGKNPSTAAAIVQQAYWPEEKIVVGELSNLPQMAVAAGIKPPATIVIGEVVKLQQHLTMLKKFDSLI